MDSDQSKKPKANTKSCSSMSGIKDTVILQVPTDWVLSMALSAATYISGFGSAHCLQLSLADVLHTYHLQHLEVSILWLYLQFHAFPLCVATHCLASQPFLWSLNWGLCDFWTLHTYKTTFTWMTPRTATSSSSTFPYLELLAHWVPDLLRIVK